MFWMQHHVSCKKGQHKNTVKQFSFSKGKTIPKLIMVSIRIMCSQYKLEDTVRPGEMLSTDLEGFSPPLS